MADEMANGAEHSRQFIDGVQSAMNERVTNLGRRQSDLETEMRSGFKAMETAFSSFAIETRASIASLSSSISDRQRPQWQALGFTLSFCTVLGALAYWPINTATSDLKAGLLAISERMVSRQEIDWRAARAVEDRARLEMSLASIRGDQIPRAELERVISGMEQRFTDQQRQLDNLDRRRGLPSP